jgi:carbon-monoxide dehydrogenase medium subunit
MMAFRLAAPTLLVDLRKLKELQKLTIDDSGVRLGARLRWRDIETDARLKAAHPLLQAAIAHTAHYQIRNRGTVGGSLAHADPAADWVAVLSAFPGFALALGPQGERRIPLAGFVPGVMETALRSDELLAAVELPVLPEATRWGHWKFCRKPGEFSKATACVLALPGAAPRAVLAALDAAPLVIPDASALLAAPETEADRIVAGLALDDPWRAALARTALRRAVEQAA